MKIIIIIIIIIIITIIITVDVLVGIVSIYEVGRPIRGREFRLGNAVIRSRAFGVGHATI